MAGAALWSTTPRRPYPDYARDLKRYRGAEIGGNESVISPVPVTPFAR